MTGTFSEFKYVLDYDFKKNSHDKYKNKYEDILDNEVGHSPEEYKTTDKIDDESSEEDGQEISEYKYTIKYRTF